MPSRAGKEPASPAQRLPSPACSLPPACLLFLCAQTAGTEPDPTTHPSLPAPGARAQLPPPPVLSWVLQMLYPHSGHPILCLLPLHPSGSCPNTFPSPDPHPLLLGSPNPIPVLQLLAGSSPCSPAALPLPQGLEHPQESLIFLLLLFSNLFYQPYLPKHPLPSSISPAQFCPVPALCGHKRCRVAAVVP